MSKCEQCLHSPTCMRYEIIKPSSPCRDFRDKETGERLPIKHSSHNVAKRYNGSICLDCTEIWCSWMQDLIPVPGWEAKKTIIKYGIKGKQKTLPSYRVTFCPYCKGAVTENGKNKKNVK